MSKSYPHMCRDGHVEIGHSDSENEMCPLCYALALLRVVEQEAADTGSISMATHGAVRDLLFSEEAMQR